MCIRDRLRIGRRRQDIGDLLVRDLVREAVAAEQEPAPGLRLQIPDVERHLGLDAERSRQHMAMRVDGRFLGRELTLADHLLHHRVVVGQLAEPCLLYTSLVVDAASVPDCLDVTARTAGGLVMGLRHRQLPIEGVQFHPESILTGQAGKDLLANFLRMTTAATV